ncbi:MAG: hypothetical protein AAF234_04225, partial [Pseudomonadota bacterium]
VLYRAIGSICVAFGCMSHSSLLLGEDEPETLPYAISSIDPMGADGKHYHTASSVLWSFVLALDLVSLRRDT